MSDLFYTVLNMSITGSYVIIAVIFARLLLKRLPKKIFLCTLGCCCIQIMLPHILSIRIQPVQS